jgi:hypothetical protein
MSKIKAIQILVIALVLVSLFASISIASASDSKAKILIDDYHGTDLGSILKSELTDREFEIEVNSDKTLDSIGLEQYDVLVIAIPAKEISETEINAVLNYVSDGGNLVLLGEDGGVIDSLNNLLKYSGIKFNKDMLEVPESPGSFGDFVEVHNFVENKIVENIKTITCFRGCTLSLSGSALALAMGNEDSYSEVYEKGAYPPVLATSSYGNGRVY